jgi:hypothetical protein
MFATTQQSWNANRRLSNAILRKCRTCDQQIGRYTTRGTDQQHHRDDAAEKEDNEVAKKKSSLSLKEKLKKYGLIGFVFHSTIWAATLGGLWAAAHNGLDLQPLMSKIPLLDADAIPKSGSSFVIAYAVTVATGPLRFGLDALCVPTIAKWISSPTQQQLHLNQKQP